MKDYREQARQFLDRMFTELESYNLNIQSHSIDHLCYRTSSLINYADAKRFLDTQGVLLVEGQVSSRPIATYKLSEPIKYKNQLIDVIEIPSPKDGSHYDQGFEHFEVVISESFEVFRNLHSDLSFDTKALSKKINPDIKLQLEAGAIKFHHQTLEKIIEIELELEVENQK